MIRSLFRLTLTPAHYCLPIALSLFAMLSACDQPSMVKLMTSPEDEHTAKVYIDLLRHGDFDKIEQDCDVSFRAKMHDVLPKMAAAIPAGEPTSVKVVGVNTFTSQTMRRSNMTFEYEFPTKWLLINVAIDKKSDQAIISGFHVSALKDSLENLNRFTLTNKSALQYGVLLLAILIQLLCLYALVQCIRMKALQRKWLWILFIFVGIGKLSVDWSSNQFSFQPIYAVLFGSGAFAAPYGPWIISISFPLGAIWFLLKHRRETQSAPERIDIN